MQSNNTIEVDYEVKKLFIGISHLVKDAEEEAYDLEFFDGNNNTIGKTGHEDAA